MPITTDTNVVTTPINNDNKIETPKLLSLKRYLYHIELNPVKCDNESELLNENKINTKIGTYTNRSIKIK